MMIQDLARRVRAIEDRLSPPEDATKPPTLREQVAEALARTDGVDDADTSWTEPTSWLPEADAVLAVVADWLAAQPLNGSCDGIQLTCGRQRELDVRLLRGVAS